MPRCVLPLLVFIFLVFGYVFCFSSLIGFSNYSDKIPGSGKGHWSLPPNMVEAIVGEFKGVASDLLLLEIASRLGDELKKVPGGWTVIEKEYDWDEIIRLFRLSLRLDPKFRNTYELVQGWVPWESGRIQESNDLLTVSQKARPWDWQPLYYQAFNTYYFLGEHGNAGKMMIEAGETPNAPSFLPILGSRLASKGGEIEAAIELMKTMLTGKDINDPSYQEIYDRLVALQGVQIIAEAVKKYDSAYGKRPDNLKDLVISGFLISLPVNPYQVEYCMDYKGKVFFDNLNCQRKDL